MKKVRVPNLPQKYHPALVTLHWLVALLIFTNIYLAVSSEDGPGQIGGIPVMNIHMLLGMLILLLLIARLVVRLTTKHPAQADAGNAFFNKVGAATHWLLYLLSFGMTITGLLLAGSTQRLARLFGLATTSGSIQPSLGLSLGQFHGLIWLFLLLLILLHVGAALYHQFILKDRLLSRMGYGKQ